MKKWLEISKELRNWFSLILLFVAIIEFYKYNKEQKEKQQRVYY